MTVASFRLNDGTPVSIQFGNNDGAISPAEMTALPALLETEVRTRYAGRTIDWNARIHISEEGPNGALVTREIAAGDLARTGAVRLFGANPMTASTGEASNNPALWTPIAWEQWGGHGNTIYHEADRWNPAANGGNGDTVWGRTIRVRDDGERYLLQPETAGQRGGDPWAPLSLFTGDGGEHPTPGGRIPSLSYRSQEYLQTNGMTLARDPTSNAGFTKMNVSRPAADPVTWTNPQVREGFVYFTGSNGDTARRSMTATGRPAEIAVREAGGRIYWRLADDRDGTIPPVPAAPVMPPQTVEIRDGANRVNVSSLSVDDRYHVVGSVRYEYMQTSGEHPVRYRRRVDEHNNPLRQPGYQREQSPGSDNWVNVTATSPRVAPRPVSVWR